MRRNLKRNLQIVLFSAVAAVVALAAAIHAAEPAGGTTWQLHSALAALQDRHYEQAEQLALDITRRDDVPQPQGWLIVAAARRRSGRDDQAETALRRFLATDPDDALKTYAEQQLEDIKQARVNETLLLTERLDSLDPKILAVVEPEQSVERSEHFTVYGWNHDLQRLIAEEAENALARLAEQLLPADEAVNVKADIYVWPDRKSYRANAPRALDASLGTASHSNTPGSNRIDLLQRNNKGEFVLATLTDVLPHEVCHVLVDAFMASPVPGRSTPPALPLALREGLAALAETSGASSRIELVGSAAATDRHIPLSTLLEADRYEEVEQIALFYAESHSLLNFLHRRLTRRQFGEFMQHLRRGRRLDDALQRTLAATRDEDFLTRLEATWRDHAILQAQTLQALARK